MAKKKPNGCLSIFTVLTVLLFTMVAGLHVLGNITTPPVVDGNTTDPNAYVRASSHLWTGVKLFYGEGADKEYVFEVLGGNDNYVMENGEVIRGIFVRYPNGSVEWKNRDYIIRGNMYWIKATDPALILESWKIY